MQGTSAPDRHGPAAREPAHHVPALDGLRGVAILLVLLFHSLGLLSSPGDGPLRWIGRAGWIGVDLFFVLSGFLITRILVDQVSAPGGLRAFYARRALRILPLYYLFLAVVFGLGTVVPALHTEGFQRVAEHQLWLWLYLSNVKIALVGDPSLFGWKQAGWVETTHFWSLAIEEQFYLFWPLLILLVPARRRTAVVAAVCIAAFSVRGLLVWSGHPVAAYVSMPARMDALGAGALVAVAWPRGGGRRGVAALLAAGSGLAAVALAVVRGGYENLDPAVLVLGYSMNAACFASLIALCVALPPTHRLRRTLSLRPLRSLGRVSYGIYVLHLPIVKLVFVSPLWGDAALRWGGGSAFFVALTLASWAIAQAVFALWERPFLDLKRRFPYPEAAQPDGRRDLESDRPVGGAAL